MKCKTERNSFSVIFFSICFFAFFVNVSLLNVTVKLIDKKTNFCYVLIVIEIQRERNFWLWLMRSYESTFKCDIGCSPLGTIKMNKYIKCF